MKSISEGAVATVRNCAQQPLVALGAVAIAMLLSVSNTAFAAVVAKTDASWKITPADPGPTPWNSDQAFNDASWQNATVLSSPSPPIFATSIWSNTGQFGNETVVWARHIFTISGAPTSAVLSYGCDDDCTIWVNGVQVINDQTGEASGGETDVLAQLHEGSNLVAFVASDNTNFGLNHGAWVQINAALPAPVPAVNIWTLVSSAGLLAAAALYALRRRIAL